MKSARFALSTLVIATLTACGGGGSGGGSSGASATATTATITGVGAKGLLAGATVQAYQVINGQEVAIGSPQTTGADGSYTLSGLPTTTNPVVVHVTTNASTTMLDELGAPTNGHYPLAANQPTAGVVMRSAISSLSADSSVMVTPFTEMAYSAAASTGAISQQSISVGNNFVQQIIGTNPTNVTPVDANVSMTASQKKMMLMLAAVQKYAADNTCAGDPSGIKCAISYLDTNAALTNSSGSYTAANGAALATTLTTKAAAVTNSSSYAQSPFNGATVSFAAPSPINPSQAVDANNLQSFLKQMQTGVVLAGNTIEKDLTATKSRLDKLVFTHASDGINTFSTILSHCNMSAGNYVCTGSQFTPNGNGYSFSFTNAGYTFNGTTSASSSGSNSQVNLTVNKTANGHTYTTINLAVTGSGITTNPNAGQINFNTFKVQEYDENTWTKYADIDFSGLSGSKDSSGNLSMSAPLSISTSDGDSLSGSLSNVKALTVSYNQPYPQSTTLITDFTLKASGISGNQNIANLTLTAHQSSAFNPYLPTSSSNKKNGIASLDILLTSNVELFFSIDNSTYNTLLIQGKLTSNGNSLYLDATENSTDNSNWTLASTGIKLTSSGNYSATLTKTNGMLNGTIYNGNSSIGTVNNGVVTAGGITISLN
jgi:hypothetical protein